VGYRVAERVAGRGAASAALRELCRIAKDELGLRTLRAITGHDNIASQRVLERSGFVVVGPTWVVDRDGLSYELDLSGL
jgi:ribosomal-protein-alanine N-acetyltransferase